MSRILSKVMVLMCAAILLMTSAAYSWGDRDHETNNRNSNYGSNKQAQGQIQGQIANGKVEVGGDDVNNKVYANAWPSLSGGEGVDQMNAYSVFGGVGLSNTEKYRAYITQIQAIEASAFLKNEEKTAMVKPLYDKMLKSNKTQRVLGVLWENDGGNIFKLITWGSFWKDKE